MILEMANMALELGVGTDNPDAEMIERAAAGDQAAFDSLMMAYQRKVLTVAWRILGNTEDARDAAQDAFLRVYRHLRKFDQSQDFAGWLYRIVVNVCRDQARKRKPASSLEGELEAGRLPETMSNDDTEAPAIYAQEQRIVLAALATLTTRERTAIVLRDLEGLSTDEVARIMDSSPGTVRSQICSGRARIREYRLKYLKRGGQK